MRIIRRTVSVSGVCETVYQLDGARLHVQIVARTGSLIHSHPSAFFAEAWLDELWLDPDAVRQLIGRNDRRYRELSFGSTLGRHVRADGLSVTKGEARRLLAGEDPVYVICGDRPAPDQPVLAYAVLRNGTRIMLPPPTAEVPPAA